MLREAHFPAYHLRQFLVGFRLTPVEHSGRERPRDQSAYRQSVSHQVSIHAPCVEQDRRLPEQFRLLSVHHLDLVDLRVHYVTLDADCFRLLPGVLGELLLVDLLFLYERNHLLFELRGFCAKANKLPKRTAETMEIALYDCTDRLMIAPLIVFDYHVPVALQFVRR